jgi:adenylate cyclase
MQHRGTIDKYMGDGLMAFWNAPVADPDHVRNALRAALAMAAAIPGIDGRLTASMGAGEPIRIGIGVNVGLASVGNIGSDHRFDYSIVGDTVNAAARLEPLSKTYGVTIVVSEAVTLAAHEFAFVPIDEVVLRGRSGRSRIFALLGGEALAATAAFRVFRLHHDVTFEAYRRGADDLADKLAAMAAHPLAAELATTYRRWRERSAGADPARVL